jgi:hypothetical protein
VDQRFTVNSPEVIEESVDGEVLIVHLGTGAYYSSDGAGEFIWRRIAAGHTAAEAAEALASHFSLASEVATGANAATDRSKKSPRRRQPPTRSPS